MIDLNIMNSGIFEEVKEMRRCQNCDDEDHTLRLSFSAGYSHVQIDLCRECMSGLYTMLDMACRDGIIGKYGDDLIGRHVEFNDAGRKQLNEQTMKQLSELFDE